MESFIQIISTVGFPIAACIGLGWFIYKFFNSLKDENKAREEKYISIIETYGVQMKSISETLALIKDDINDLKTR